MLSFTSNAAAQLILWLQGLILKLLASALFGAVKFFQWVVNFQSGAFNITVVQELWRTMRDFANMFFILMMVFVALAAVLSLNKYDWRKLLPRIIVAAFLINFSYPICLLVIQFSQTLTNIALNLIGHDIAGNIGAALQLNKVNPLVLGAGVGGAGATSAIAGTLISTVFITVLLAIALVSLITAGGFLFYRIPYLWGSIIFAPLAWTMGVFKAEQFEKWKKNFIAWTMFLPYYMFMLFIGLLVLSKRAAIESQLHLQTNADLTFFNFAFQDIFFYVFSIMVLVGSLKIAKEAAFASGTEASKAMNKVSGAVNQWAMNRSYLSALSKGFSQKKAEILEKGLPGKPAWWKYGGERTEKLREAGVASAFGLEKSGAKARKAQEFLTSDVQNEESKFLAWKKQMNEVEFKNAINGRFATAQGTERVALAKIRADNGWETDADSVKETTNLLGGSRTDAGRNYINSLKKQLDKIYKNPAERLAAVRAADIDDELKRILAENIAKKAEIIDRAMTKELASLYENQPKEVQKRFYDELIKSFNNFNATEKQDILSDPDISKDIKRVAANSLIDKQQIVDAAMARRVLALFSDESPEEQKKIAERLFKSVDSFAIGEREAMVNDATMDPELRKVAAKSLADSLQISDKLMVHNIARLYAGDTKEEQKRIMDSLQKNINTFSTADREDLVRTAASAGATAEEKIGGRLGANSLLESNEIDSLELRNISAGVVGVVGSKEYSKFVNDANKKSIRLRAEADYLAKPAALRVVPFGVNPIDFERSRITELLATELDGMSSEELKTLSAEELKTPEMQTVIHLLPPTKIAELRKASNNREKRKAIDAGVASPSIVFNYI